MPTKLLIFTTSLIFIFSLLVVSSLGLANDTGPEIMELKTSAGKKSARFPHKKHQGNFECQECHHVKTDDGIKSPLVEGMKVKRCTTCHNKEDMTNPKLNSFKLAAHGLCKECHKKNKESAPTKCSGCHIK